MLGPERRKEEAARVEWEEGEGEERRGEERRGEERLAWLNRGWRRREGGSHALYRELFERGCSRDDATAVLAPAEGVSRGRGHQGWRASRGGGESVGLVGERLSVGCQRASQSLRAAQAPTTHSFLLLHFHPFRPSAPLSRLVRFAPSFLHFPPAASLASPSNRPLVHLSLSLAFSFIPFVSLSSEFTPLLRATSTLQCCPLPPPPILHI